MNIVHKLTMRHLLLNKKRTLVTIVGVILSVAMITAVTTFAVSAQDMLIRDEINSRGNWHASYRNIEAGKADVFREANDVKVIMINRDLGFAMLVGGTNVDKPYLFIRQFDQACLENMPIHLVEGRLPQREDELVVSEHIYYNGGVQLKVGDKLTLPIGYRLAGGQKLGQSDSYTEGAEVFLPEYSQEFTVTGIISRPSFESRSAPGYTVISYLEGDSIKDADKVNISVQFKTIDRGFYDRSQELALAVGMVGREFEDGFMYYPDLHLNSNLVALSGVTQSNRINGVVNAFGLIAIIVIMVGSVSLIYNAFAISISERSRQLGMMASVGATKAQKRNSVFFEGLLIGLIGIPLGLLAGTVGMGVTFYFVDPILASIMETAVELRLVVSPPSILIATVFSVLTIFISVWIPSRQASQISPMDAIRQSQDVKLTGKVVRTSRITRAIFGFEAELALKNLKRNRRRYRATVVSLSVSIILFLTVSAYAAYLTVGSNMYARDTNYDLFIGAYDGSIEISIQEQRDFYHRVIAMEWVDQYVYERNVIGMMRIEPERASHLVNSRYGYGVDEDGKYPYYAYIKSIDDNAFAEYARVAGVNTSDFASRPLAIAVNLSRIYLDGIFVETEVIKIKVGDVLEFDLTPFEDELIYDELSIAAVTKSVPMGTTVWNDPQTLTLIVPESVFDSLIEPLEAREIYGKGNLYVNSSKPELLEMKVRELHQESFAGRLQINNRAKEAKQDKQLKLLILIFIGGFIALITAICIANIFNTISTSIGLRRREFAMLKSVGMTPKGFNNMIRYESIFYGIKALSFALPVSMGINYSLYRAMRSGFQFSFSMSWGGYGIAIFSVFAVVFTTMLYSSAKIKRENIIDSLKDENM